MKKATIEIETDTEPFKENPEEALAYSLRNLASKVEAGVKPIVVSDSKGNIIGTVVYDEG